MTELATGVGLDVALEAHARERMARWRIPGVAVGELSGDARALAGFGVTSLETGYPVRPDSLFQIGSISKVFTATLVMMLVEEGKLDLDTPVIAYLPDLKLADPAARERVTLRMLLSHSAGFFGDFFEDFGQGDGALGRYVGKLDTLAQQTPPGESWAYNNAGFCLAGALVERVTGQPFERVMRERVFAPLGLERSFYFAHEAITYPVAVGHTQKTPGGDEHEVARLYPLPRAVNAAGGIISTVDDLLTFAAFHMDGGVTRDGQRLLSEAATRAMWEPQITAANFAEAYATGWETRLIDGVRLVAHGGSTNGFQAQLDTYPGAALRHRHPDQQRARRDDVQGGRRRAAGGALQPAPAQAPTDHAPGGGSGALRGRLPPAQRARNTDGHGGQPALRDDLPRRVE